MEENVDGFVFKRKKKKRKLNQLNATNNNNSSSSSTLSKFAATSAASSSSSFSSRTNHANVTGTTNLPPISNNLPAYPETTCPANVRGPTFDNIKGSVYEKDAHRLINLFNNVTNKEMESINKVFPADGPYGLFNFLATTVSSDFLTRSKNILLASAKQQEMRAKSNAPYMRPLPLNDQLRAREAVLNSLIDKFEREKESWEKASGKADEEESKHHDNKMLLQESSGDSDGNGNLAFSKPDIVLGSVMSETLKRFVVQIDQIYEVLENSRKKGESLEKQRKALSEVIHATAHYNGAGSSLDMIKGFTRTSKNDGALIRAFTQESSDEIMGTGKHKKNKNSKENSNNSGSDGSVSVVANKKSNALVENDSNVTTVTEEVRQQKEIIEKKATMKKTNPLNLLKNMTA